MSLLGRDAVADLALVLAGPSIPVMPLKGVLAQQQIYDDPAERELIDADVLVPEHRFDEAVEHLEAAGYREIQARMAHERAFRAPRDPIVVDVHRRLFPHLRYRLATDGLFQRGRYDTALFGVPVVLPTPQDQLAHIVGHVANDHVDHRTGGKYARDIALLAERTCVTPATAAQHLARFGLARAARYSLAVVCHDAPEFCDAVLRELPADPLGVGLAHLAREVVASGSARSRRGTLPSYLLATTLPRSAAALAYAAFDKARFKSRERRRLRT